MGGHESTAGIQQDRDHGPAINLTLHILVLASQTQHQGDHGGSRLPDQIGDGVIGEGAAGIGQRP